MVKNPTTNVAEAAMAMKPHIHLHPAYCTIYAFIKGPRNTPPLIAVWNIIMQCPLSWK
jgi:hypothetical protein